MSEVDPTLNSLARNIFLAAALGAVDAQLQAIPESGACYRRVGEGYAVFFTPKDSNSAMELGVSTTEEQIRQIEQFFSERHSEIRILVRNEAAVPDLVRMLQDRQYAKTERLATHWRALPWQDQRTFSTAIPVTEIGPDTVETWARTVQQGFHEASGPASTEIDEDEIRAFTVRAIRDGCYPFLATCSGELAGGAVVQMHEGVALLRTASVRFSHRRRGVQQALIATRLAYASDYGCRIAFCRASVGSGSQRNLMRFGFKLLEEGGVFSKPAQ